MRGAKAQSCNCHHAAAGRFAACSACLEQHTPLIADQVPRASLGPLCTPLQTLATGVHPFRAFRPCAGSQKTVASALIPAAGPGAGRGRTLLLTLAAAACTRAIALHLIAWNAGDDGGVLHRLECGGCMQLARRRRPGLPGSRLPPPRRRVCLGAVERAGQEQAEAGPLPARRQYAMCAA